MNNFDVKKRSLVLLLVLSFTLVSCLDQIPLSIPEGQQEGLVIQAKLLKSDPSVLEVQISRLFNFDLASFNRILAEQVILRNEAGQEILVPRKGTSIYRAKFPEDFPDFIIDYNQKYQLEVQMADGQLLQSTYESLLPVPKIDSISLALKTRFIRDPMEPDGFVLDSTLSFGVNTALKQAGQEDLARLRWLTERTYKITERRFILTPFQDNPNRKTCYVTDFVDVLRPQALNGEALNTDYLADNILYEEPLGQLFFEGYYFSVYQESLSRDAYRYFSQIEEVTQRTGNMFEPVAGVVKSNFTNINDPSEKVYGYFYATEQDTFRQYVEPGVYTPIDTFCVDVAFELCEGAPIRPCHPDPCIECLEWSPNTSATPPDFWKE